jgi:hypothetical protein
VAAPREAGPRIWLGPLLDNGPRVLRRRRGANEVREVDEVSDRPTGLRGTAKSPSLLVREVLSKPPKDRTVSSPPRAGEFRRTSQL